MTISAKALMAGLSQVGYVVRNEERLALTSLFLQTQGTRVMIIEGAPGCGKTSLPEKVAEVLESPKVFYLCHAWTDDSELFTGIDVPSAVAGDAANVRQLGVLAQVAELSKGASPDHPVICILDEIDKTADRVENLLLDVLQTGRVPFKPGVHLQINLQNVIFFITSNGLRELGDALLRRMRRLHMQPLKVELVDDLVAGWTKADKGLVSIVRKAAMEVAQSEGTAISPQEIRRLVDELVNLRRDNAIHNAADVQLCLAGWAVKRPAKGLEHARKTKHNAAIWGMLKRIKPTAENAAE
jgi:MoxR-like ATPase